MAFKFNEFAKSATLVCKCTDATAVVVIAEHSKIAATTVGRLTMVH
jgi:hypothetical protein